MSMTIVEESAEALEDYSHPDEVQLLWHKEIR